MAAPNNTSEYIAIAEPADQVRFGYLLVGESRHLSGMRHLHTQILYCADSSGVAVTTSDAREPLLAHLHQYNRSDSTKSQVDMKILIADSFPATHQEKLTSEGHVLSVDPSLDGDALTAAIAGHEVLIVRSTKVPAATLDAADSLKLVIRAGAGTNTIDKDAAAKAGIRVCNVPGANAIAVAELVMGMMICLDRNIPDNVMDLNNRVWNKKKYSVARGLYGQSVGILGLGSIGFAVAERAAAFGMQVYAIAKPGRTDDAEKRIQDAGIQQLTSMDELLSHCDIITLHLPATAETTSMVNEEFLNKLKDGAMFINTSRGELVDEAALLKAMDNKGIRVGLDVYNNEPGAGDSSFSSDIATHPGVCSTHHIGASTTQAQVAVSNGVLDVIAAYQNSEFKNCVN